MIGTLAYYTLESPLNSDASMVIGPVTGAGSEIMAFVFDHYCVLDFQDEMASLLLCLAIAKAELDYKSEHDGNRQMAC